MRESHSSHGDGRMARPRLLQTFPWELATLDLATPGAKLRSKFLNFKHKVDEHYIGQSILVNMTLEKFYCYFRTISFPTFEALTLVPIWILLDRTAESQVVSTCLLSHLGN